MRNLRVAACGVEAALTVDTSRETTGTVFRVLRLGCFSAGENSRHIIVVQTCNSFFFETQFFCDLFLDHFVSFDNTFLLVLHERKNRAREVMIKILKEKSEVKLSGFEKLNT